jgi:hypothetical protein
MFAQSLWNDLSKRVCALVLIGFGCSAVCHSSTVNIQPGQDIAAIVAANAAGTTYVIYPGVYRLTQHIVPKTGDTFIGQTACAPPKNTCPALLTGSRIIGPLAKLSGGVYQVTGQTQQGSVPFTNKICQTGYLGCNLPEDLFFDGKPYQHLNATTLPTIGSGQWWFDYAHSTIYFHDNPAGHNVETSVLDTAFLSSANNVTIQYLTIRGFAAPAQRGGLESTDGNPFPTTSANWVVKNCDIYNNHGFGIRMTYGMKLYNSYVHDNGLLGVGAATASMSPSGIVVQGNTISHNNYAKALSGWGGGGFKTGYTANLVFRGNIVSNNDGTGVHFDQTSTNPIVDGNVVSDNAGGGGIEYEISVNSALIRNNLVLRNGIPDAVAASSAGIGSYASTGVVSYCNVIEIPNNKGANGPMVVASNRGYNTVAPYQYLMSTGNTFHHNTVIWDAGSSSIVGYAQGDAAHQPNFFQNNPPPDYNTYHLPSASAANFMYDNNNSQSNARKTFSQYQAAGADIHGSADANNNSGFPAVVISSPADQSSFTTSSVTVNATASDNSGINRVEFYVDWVKQATVAGSPYSYTYSNAKTGSHTIVAMAYSNAGIRSCFAVTVTKQ